MTTGEGYVLRKIFANQVVQTFNSGRTKPLLVSGICQTTNEKGEFVVKLRNSEITNQHYVHELIGSFVAMELGLNVPEPVVIEITEPLKEAYIGTDYYAMLGNSLGYSFGSKYKEGVFQFTKDQKLSPLQLEQAIKIFVFDAFILNPDRGANDSKKQNMFVNGEEVIVYDHESAFGFIYAIFPNKTPWLLQENDRNWLVKHHFYPYIQGRLKKASQFIDTFDVLNDTFWDKVETAIPEEWKTDKIKPIREYLSLIVSNREIFKEQLKAIMS